MSCSSGAIDFLLIDACPVTRVGFEQRFRVRDLRRIQYWPGSGPSPYSSPAQRHQFHHGHHTPFGHGMGAGAGQPRLIPGQDLAPKVFYLFTSPDKAHVPYFSDTPVYRPLSAGEKAPELDARAAQCFAFLDVYVKTLGIYCSLALTACLTQNVRVLELRPAARRGLRELTVIVKKYLAEACPPWHKVDTSWRSADLAYLCSLIPCFWNHFGFARFEPWACRRRRRQV